MGDIPSGVVDDTVEQMLRAPGIPRDARLVALILKSMGVEHFEPRVVLQLMEFMHRYTTEVIQTAEVYATHANKDSIAVDDIRLAIQSQVNSSFIQPPPRELMMELAQKKNSIPLPPIPDRLGILLPPEEDCLTSVNYHVDPRGDCGGARASGMLVKGGMSTSGPVTPTTEASPAAPAPSDRMDVE